MTIRETWEKKKASQASAQAFARSGEIMASNGRQSAGGIKVPLAAIFAALSAFSKRAAEKLRQKHKGNDGRSQTSEESAPILGGCRLGLASEPEEQEETGGSRIALLILLASLTSLALWAQCWDDKGTYTCISAFSGCKPRTGTSGSLWTSWGENKQSQCRSVLPSDESENDCNDEPIGCVVWVNYVTYSGKKCTGPITLSGVGWYGLMGTHAVLSGVPCIGDNY